MGHRKPDLSQTTSNKKASRAKQNHERAWSGRCHLQPVHRTEAPSTLALASTTCINERQLNVKPLDRRGPCSFWWKPSLPPRPRLIRRRPWNTLYMGMYTQQASFATHKMIRGPCARSRTWTTPRRPERGRPHSAHCRRSAAPPAHNCTCSKPWLSKRKPWPKHTRRSAMQRRPALGLEGDPGMPQAHQRLPALSPAPAERWKQTKATCASQSLHQSGPRFDACSRKRSCNKISHGWPHVLANDRATCISATLPRGTAAADASNTSMAKRAQTTRNAMLDNKTLVRTNELPTAAPRTRNVT